MVLLAIGDMSAEFFSDLPPPQRVKTLYKANETQEAFVAASRKKAQNIVQGIDKSLAIVLGPCSIHDSRQTIAYAKKLKESSQNLSSFLIMRVFFEKPRTTLGWKGFIYDPDLNGSNDMVRGIYEARKLLLTLADMEIPVATEFVDPLIAPYIEDLITWGFIGARTSSSQPHRQLASSFSFPMGMKNSLDGDLLSAIQGVIAARSSHVFATINPQGKIGQMQSRGNPYSHVVLRGSLTSPNYDRESLKKTLKTIHYHGITSKVLIDCSHGNSQKNYLKQKEVFLSALEQIRAGNSEIIGVMLESHLNEGHQTIGSDPSTLDYGISVTDPCMGWSMTQELLSSSEELLLLSRSG